MSSTILIQNTQRLIDLTGDPCRADGWYGYGDSLYTVAITTANFLGQIFIEASLALFPDPNDWFPIELIPSLSHLTFPIISDLPTGLYGGDSGTTGYTFRGNFLYLRARVVRSDVYGSSNPVDIPNLGDARIILSQGHSTYSASTTLPPIVGFTQLTNIGSGYQIYAGVNQLGVPQFRAIAPGGGIAIVQSNDTLTINALTTGGGPILSENGTFLELTDTPSSYIDSGDAFLIVNTQENAITFRKLPAIALSGIITDATGILPVSSGGTGRTAFNVNGLLIGNGAQSFNVLNPPNIANTVLTWTGTAFVWSNPSVELGSLIVSQDGLNPLAVSTINFTGNGVSVIEQPPIAPETISTTAIVSINTGAVLPAGSASVARYTIKIGYASSIYPNTVLDFPPGWLITLTMGLPIITVTHNLNLRLSYFMVTGFNGTTYSTTGEGTIYTQTGALYTDNLSLQLTNMTSTATHIGNSNPNAFIFVDLFFVV